MEASGSDLFMTVMTVQLISTGKIEMKPCQCLRTCACTYLSVGLLFNNLLRRIDKCDFNHCPCFWESPPT